jgi:deoxyribodipyrimidine photo-lyase
MQNARNLTIKEASFSGNSVIYIMSRDQRVQDNHALLAAQECAQEKNVPLYVLFVLRKFKHRSREHYNFMVEGLKEVSKELSSLNIPFIIREGDPENEISTISDELSAGALFFDFSPLKGARALVKTIAKGFGGSVTVVDTHNIIPVWVASDKQEFAAHTMRRKIHKKLEEFIVSPGKLEKQKQKVSHINSLSFADVEKFVNTIPESGIKVDFEPGESAAHDVLKEFIKNDLKNYARGRNDIAYDNQSGLSPYLHYGQISALRVALDVIDAVNEPPLLFQQPKMAEHSDQPNEIEGMNVLLEEMVVRKEIADNFCFYSPSYTSFDGAADWAKKTLSKHATDTRDFVYSAKEWEAAETHDIIWNASQKELIKSGKIHGYMRMYWAKKMLEWSESPKEALKTAIYLNDKYSIDGGDPNGYVGILWSIAGLHDRPWFERPVFGQIRYMNDGGLRRKFHVDEYINRI